ncbi:MAG TPA: hypothetical protein VGI26_09025 [Solirubrobacteraceae bacterium]
MNDSRFATTAALGPGKIFQARFSSRFGLYLDFDEHAGIRLHWFAVRAFNHQRSHGTSERR